MLTYVLQLQQCRTLISYKYANYCLSDCSDRSQKVNNQILGLPAATSGAHRGTSGQSGAHQGIAGKEGGGVIEEGDGGRDMVMSESSFLHKIFILLIQIQCICTL